MLKRRLITQAITEQLVLNTAAMPVGLSKAPADGGWDGQPSEDESSYQPYGVLIPGSSGPRSSEEFSHNMGGSDWKLPYTVSSFGILPNQTEFAADDFREVFAGMMDQLIIAGDETYLVQQVRIESIGGLQRVDSVDPQIYAQTDSFTIWLGEEI